MMRHELPITEVPLKKEVKGVDHGITAESIFWMAEAVNAAGLGLEKLLPARMVYNPDGSYSDEYLGFCLSWYKNHNLVDAHVRDANTKRYSKVNKGGR